MLYVQNVDMTLGLYRFPTCVFCEGRKDYPDVGNMLPNYFDLTQSIGNNGPMFGQYYHSQNLNIM